MLRALPALSFGKRLPYGQWFTIGVHCPSSRVLSAQYMQDSLVDAGTGLGLVHERSKPLPLGIFVFTEDPTARQLYYLH